MQNLDQFASASDALWMAIEARLSTLFTALPVILTQDGDGHSATSKSAILGLIRDDQENTTTLPLPGFDTMPVHFPGGGLVVSTHPQKANDEGIALFLSRAIDSWRQSGGEQAPIDSRQHHLSDAVYIGGVRSDPRKIANVSADAIHHRSVDGKQTRELHPVTGAHDKAVDPSDSASDPFNAALTYFESKVHPSAGNSWRRKTPTKDHNVNLTDSGFTVSTSDSSIPASAGFAVTPSGVNLGGNGSVGSADLANGSAAANVGALGGDLSGTLPNPKVVGVHLTPVSVSALPSPSGAINGALAIVNDSSGTTWRAVVAGGGSDKALVRCDGANWVVVG